MPHVSAPPDRGAPTPRRRACYRRASAAVALLVAATLPACKAAAPAFGNSAESARANSGAFFGAWSARYTNVQRTPKFETARGKLSRYALAPSGVFGDSSVWTSGAGDTRVITIAARMRGNRYVFDATPTAAPPRKPGDGWHMMQLRRLGDDQWEWNTAVDFAVGRATPDDLLDVQRALLATAAANPEAVLRAQYRTGFPRTTAVMGQLATLDSLELLPLRDGSAVIDMHLSLHPERLRARYPHFAQYIVKYFRPARYDISLADRGGGRWMMSSMRDNRLFFRVRALADGRLAPLDGVPRPMPDTLVMRGDFSARFSIFNVGVTGLTADVAVLGSPRERGWQFRFRKEPDWHFPLAVNALIRTALRRPFADEGVQLRVAARSRADGMTLISRRLDIDVQEGAIVRWLGGLGAGAMSDFSGRAEEDENRFLADLFAALQDDFASH
ncbi:MAG: hypothetical protein ACYC2G_15970 [Gemmatimonadaceae bacterium]